MGMIIHIEFGDVRMHITQAAIEEEVVRKEMNRLFGRLHDWKGEKVAQKAEELFREFCRQYMVGEVKMDKICEVCGKPATNRVRDIRCITRPIVDTYRKYEPHGKPHFFCDEHNRESEIISGESLL